VRGGFGLFYNGFENRGFSPNIGENYPFQFNFSFFPGLKTTSAGAFDPTGLYPYATAGPGGTPCGGIGANPMKGLATYEAGFSCTPLSPLSVNASGLALRGIQFNYITPYAMSGNLTLQYQLTSSMSVQAGYVTSLARHLEVFPNSNNVTGILPSSTDPTKIPVSQGGVPFPDFGQGSSFATTNANSAYHGLQTKVEKQFAGGLNFLAAYTWSKTRSDANDLLNN